MRNLVHYASLSGNPSTHTGIFDVVDKGVILSDEFTQRFIPWHRVYEIVREHPKDTNRSTMLSASLKKHFKS